MDAIDIVGQELRFHTKHKGMTDRGKDYEEGFIDALVHIHNLLLVVQQSEKELSQPVFTEGICEDGAAILKDGVPMKITEILEILNRKGE